MKNWVVSKCMSIVNYDNRFNNTKLEEIRYGLEGLYMQITKLIVIAIIAILLNVFKELIILLIAFNVIRSTSFGMHASKSWICLTMSLILFVGGALLVKYLVINNYIKTIFNLVNIGLIYKYSPADTQKRPITNPKRRLCYKYISTFIAITYSFLSLFTHNLISNCLVLSLCLQSFMIAPIVYKIFKLPYNNYLSYNDI